MPPRPGFEDKIDILDLIISILKDHEESLSNFVDRLEVFIKNLSSLEKKISNLDKIPQPGRSTSEDRRILLVECKRWSDFKDINAGASLVAFETEDNALSVSSASRDFIFRYSEKLPDVDDSMTVHSGDSVCRKVSCLNPLGVRRWLSEELRVPEDKIIEGRLLTNRACFIRVRGSRLFHTLSS